MKQYKKTQIEKDINDIADYYRQTKSFQKYNLIVSLIYTILILIFIFGTIITLTNSKSSIFGDKYELSRKFLCESKNKNYKDIVKTYQEAKTFIELFNGTCVLQMD